MHDPEKDREAAQRLGELLGGTSSDRTETITARPGRRGRRWYWSLLWPEPLPVRRWSHFSWPWGMERRSKHFEWGWRIGREFITQDTREAYATQIAAEVLSLSYVFLVQKTDYPATLPNSATALKHSREKFAAVWQIMTSPERERVALPDVDKFVWQRLNTLLGPDRATVRFDALMTNRAALNDL